MLTKLTIRNFKSFNRVEIELGNPVVFIGPNNSGKTNALQALALWDIGLNRWNEKRKGKTTREKRPGVTINRRDLIAVPVPNAKLLWRDLHIREASTSDGKQRTENVRVDIRVDGVSNGNVWECGFEFDYANEESFYCRPLRLSDETNPQRMVVPDEAAGIHVAYLQPMSGLALTETRLDRGAINVRLGEGRTAEVLRNLCYHILTENSNGSEKWELLCTRIEKLFGVNLVEPVYIEERGEIVMSYRTQGGIQLDISSAGRGLQQTLLLLAHLTFNPGSVLLLDEPDAHLEILRQRQIYQLLTEWAEELGSQIIAASHSEVILNEAADRDVVVAFLGKPHRIDDRGGQLVKSLKEIGFDQYYQAEQTGWVLYLEGATDLAILRSFARRLDHPVAQGLERPFVHYIQNLPSKARDHFRGLRECKQDLVGYTLCDRDDLVLQPTTELHEYKWKRREIENYLCEPETLLAFAEDLGKQSVAGPLFESTETEERRNTMQECIDDFAPPAALRDRSDTWWVDIKASRDFLDRVFQGFFKKLNLPNLMAKTDYHVLAGYVAENSLPDEVTEVLDGILAVSRKARPTQEQA